MADQDPDFDENGIYREKDYDSGDQGVHLDDDGIWHGDPDPWRSYNYERTTDSGFATADRNSLPADDRSLGISDLEASESNVGDDNVSLDRTSYRSEDRLDLPELYDDSYMIESGSSRPDRGHVTGIRTDSVTTDYSEYDEDCSRKGGHGGYYDDDRSYSSAADSYHGDDPTREGSASHLDNQIQQPGNGNLSYLYAKSSKVPPVKKSRTAAGNSGINGLHIVGDSLFTQEDQDPLGGQGHSLLEFEELETALRHVQGHDASGEQMDLIGAYLSSLTDQDDTEGKSWPDLRSGDRTEPRELDDRDRGSEMNSSQWDGEGSISEIMLIPRARDQNSTRDPDPDTTLESRGHEIQNEGTHADRSPERSRRPGSAAESTRIPMLRNRSPSLSRPGSSCSGRQRRYHGYSPTPHSRGASVSPTRWARHRAQSVSPTRGARVGGDRQQGAGERRGTPGRHGNAVSEDHAKSANQGRTLPVTPNNERPRAGSGSSRHSTPAADEICLEDIERDNPDILSSRTPRDVDPWEADTSPAKPEVRDPEVGDETSLLADPEGERRSQSEGRDTSGTPERGQTRDEGSPTEPTQNKSSTSRTPSPVLLKFPSSSGYSKRRPLKAPQPLVFTEPPSCMSPRQHQRLNRQQQDSLDPRSSTSCDESEDLSQSSVRSRDIKHRYIREVEQRKEKEQTLQELHQQYNNLLKKYAEAENTIDELRVGAKVTLYSDLPTPGQAQTGTLAPAQHAQVFSIAKTGSASLGTMATGGSAQPQNAILHGSRPASRASFTSGTLGPQRPASVTSGARSPQPETDAGEASLAEEGSKLALLAKAGNVHEQTHALQILLDESYLEVGEQETAMSNIRASLDRLHQDFRDARAEHDMRRRQALAAGLPAPESESEFDQDKDVEGELHRLAMTVDDLDYRVQENIKQRRPARVPFQNPGTSAPTPVPGGGPVKADHSIGIYPQDHQGQGQRQKLKTTPSAANGGQTTADDDDDYDESVFDQSVDDSETLSPRRPPSVGSVAGGTADIDEQLHRLNKDYNGMMDRYRRLKQLRRTPETDREVRRQLRNLRHIYEKLPEHRKPALPPELEKQYNAAAGSFVRPDGHRRHLERTRRGSLSSRDEESWRSSERTTEPSNRGSTSTAVESDRSTSTERGLPRSKSDRRGSRHSPGGATPSDVEYTSSGSTSGRPRAVHGEPASRRLPEGLTRETPGSRSRPKYSADSSGTSARRLPVPGPGRRSGRDRRREDKDSGYVGSASSRKMAEQASQGRHRGNSGSQGAVRSSALRSPRAEDYDSGGSGSTASTVEERPGRRAGQGGRGRSPAGGSRAVHGVSTGHQSPFERLRRDNDTPPSRLHGDRLARAEEQSESDADSLISGKQGPSNSQNARRVPAHSGRLHAAQATTIPVQVAPTAAHQGALTAALQAALAAGHQVAPHLLHTRPLAADHPVGAASGPNSGFLAQTAPPGGQYQHYPDQPGTYYHPYYPEGQPAMQGQGPVSGYSLPDPNIGPAGSMYPQLDNYHPEDRDTLYRGGEHHSEHPEHPSSHRYRRSPHHRDPDHSHQGRDDRDIPRRGADGSRMYSRYPEVDRHQDSGVRKTERERVRGGRARHQSSVDGPPRRSRDATGRVRESRDHYGSHRSLEHRREAVDPERAEYVDYADHGGYYSDPDARVRYMESHERSRRDYRQQDATGTHPRESIRAPPREYPYNIPVQSGAVLDEKYFRQSVGGYPMGGTAALDSAGVYGNSAAGGAQQSTGLHYYGGGNNTGAAGPHYNYRGVGIQHAPQMTSQGNQYAVPPLGEPVPHGLFGAIPGSSAATPYNPDGYYGNGMGGEAGASLPPGQALPQPANAPCPLCGGYGYHSHGEYVHQPGAQYYSVEGQPQGGPAAVSLDASHIAAGVAATAGRAVSPNATLIIPAATQQMPGVVPATAAEQSGQQTYIPVHVIHASEAVSSAADDNLNRLATNSPAARVRYYVREYGAVSDPDEEGHKEYALRRTQHKRGSSKAKGHVIYDHSEPEVDVDELNDSLRQAVVTARRLKHMSHRMKHTLHEELVSTH